MSNAIRETISYVGGAGWGMDTHGRRHFSNERCWKQSGYGFNDLTRGALILYGEGWWCITIISLHWPYKSQPECWQIWREMAAHGGRWVIWSLTGASMRHPDWDFDDKTSRKSLDSGCEPSKMANTENVSLKRDAPKHTLTFTSSLDMALITQNQQYQTKYTFHKEQSNKKNWFKWAS